MASCSFPLQDVQGIDVAGVGILSAFRQTISKQKRNLKHRLQRTKGHRSAQTTERLSKEIDKLESLNLEAERFEVAWHHGWLLSVEIKQQQIQQKPIARRSYALETWSERHNRRS